MTRSYAVTHTQKTRILHFGGNCTCADSRCDNQLENCCFMQKSALMEEHWGIEWPISLKTKFYTKPHPLPSRACTHPSTSPYPVIAALRGGIQENSDVGLWEVLQAPLPPILVLLVSCKNGQRASCQTEPVAKLSTMCVSALGTIFNTFT